MGQSVVVWWHLSCCCISIPPVQAADMLLLRCLSCTSAAVLLALATFGALCLLRPLSRLMGCGQCLGSQRSKQPATTAAPTPAITPADSLTNTSPFVPAKKQCEQAANGDSKGASTEQPAGCKGGLQGFCMGLRQLCSHMGDATRHLGLPGLFVAAVVASLCYCSIDLASTAVGAFQCTALDPVGAAGMIPGERRAAQGSWWSRNLNVRCYGQAQVAAAGVAAAICLPLLVLTVLCVALVVQSARYKQSTPTGQQLYTTWLAQLWGKRRAYQQCRAGDRSVGMAGHRWAEAWAAAGVTFVVPFKAVNPAALWAVAAVVFRIALAILLTALDHAIGSSVLMRAVVASGAIACMQLLLSWVQPGADRGYDRILKACYMVLQVLCVLTVAAETLQPVGPASRAVLYTLLVIVGSINCLFMAWKAARSFFACLV